MHKKEFLQKSPIRILEKTIHGGIGKANLGVFTARKGLGKTACLVHMAIDTVLNERKILHISFADDPHHIENWYKQVFDEISKTYKLEEKNQLFQQVIKDRFILHFKRTDTLFENVKNTILQLTKESNFLPEVIIVDGCNLESSSHEDISNWKALAKEMDVEMMFSATMHRENLELDEENIPAPVNKFKDLFSVIIMMQPEHDYVSLNLLKDHDSKDIEKLHLKLDPKSLLIANHRI